MAGPGAQDEAVRPRRETGVSVKGVPSDWAVDTDALRRPCAARSLGVTRLLGLRSASE